MFVCLGNICRSPAAQAVMQSIIAQAELSDRFEIDSAGTASYHIGKGPDARMIAAGVKRGLRFTSVAKAFTSGHSKSRDLIIAMDRDNYRDILAISGVTDSPQICLFSKFLDESWPTDVPDPYYGGESGFEYVLDMLQAGCPKILEQFTA
jgi:protein-tyrosine phosphatase